MPKELVVSQVLPEGVNPEYVVLVDGVWYDLCVGVGCKVNTGVPTSYPVEIRKYWVDGSGQLCKGCFDLIYPRGVE